MVLVVIDRGYPKKAPFQGLFGPPWVDLVQNGSHLLKNGPFQLQVHIYLSIYLSIPMYMYIHICVYMHLSFYIYIYINLHLRHRTL